MTKNKQNLPAKTNSAPAQLTGFAKARELVTDGWQNIMTGLGITGLDKNRSSKLVWSPMSEIEADEFHAQSDIAKRIIEDLPSEALREGYDVCFKDKDTDLSPKIQKEEERLHVSERIETAWSWARAYGGAGIVIVTPDMALDTPINPDQLEKISTLVVASRYELQANTLDNDVRSDNFGLPLYYNFTPRSGGTSMIVHYTRVIRFEGAKLTRRQFVRNNYWDDSVLTRCKQPIANYEIANEAVALTLQDFSVAVHKIKGLGDIMKAKDGDEKVMKRMSIVNLTRSVARTIVVDTDAEDFTYQQRTVTGMSDLVQTLSNRLVASSEMPHTRLLGESPSGLGATGNSEQTNWHDFVSSKQENYLKPKMMKLYTLILKAKQGPTAGNIPEGMNIDFRPLEQMSEKEEADVRYLNAQSDQIYVDTGILDPKEIRDSRWGAGKYSTDIQIEATPEVDPTLNNSALPAPTAEPDMQATALNGAQVTSLLGLVTAYKMKTIDKPGAVAFIQASFPTVTEAQANTILGEQTGVALPEPEKKF